MSIKFSKHNNVLLIEDNEIVFDHNIRYVKEVKDTLIVLLEIPSNTQYPTNVFGLSRNGEIKWRIQSDSVTFPIKNQLPLENLIVSGNDVFVSDFYGRRFLLNPTNGEILSCDVKIK